MALICRTLVSQPSLWHRLIAILITKLHSEIKMILLPNSVKVQLY